MKNKELKAKLDWLLQQPESELIEFKHAEKDFKYDRLGEYFCALSNEANLRGAKSAWLIFGVDDKIQEDGYHKVLGTRYKYDSVELQKMKHEISKNTALHLTFTDIYEIQHKDGRVILFEIPATPLGIPMSWNGEFKGRHGESIVPLDVSNIGRIISQTAPKEDWSAVYVDDATLDDLDTNALILARRGFVRHTNKIPATEIETWSDEEFLKKVRLMSAKGKITRASLVLLGRPESAVLLSPNPVQITWVLEGEEEAYEHFDPPFILSTTEVFRRIRNVKLKIVERGSMIPVEISKYNEDAVLEALHNCIAHQDYTKNGRITVAERVDRLVLNNLGGFFEGTVDDYVLGNKRPNEYRNQLLARAMVEIGMIDAVGNGIREIYKHQIERYLPLPDYIFEPSDTVSLTIYGKPIDSDFTQILVKNLDLTLSEIVLLDALQKGRQISKVDADILREMSLIEGRYPNVHISKKVAEVTGEEARYLLAKGQNKQYYETLVLDYIKEFGEATRPKLEELTFKKFADTLSREQKEKQLDNMLTKLRRSGQIINIGSRTESRWVFSQ